jgi:cell division protein FtsI (penicillin-binding protein 3)
VRIFGASGEPRSARTMRRGTLLGFYVLFGALIVGKAVKLQVLEHEHWAAVAQDQHRERLELPARRGAIFDRKGVPLALSHEMYQVAVAPRELRDPRAAARLLADGLGLPAALVDEAVRSDRRWVVLPGRYTADQRRQVGNARGIHFERQFERFYPQGDAGREVIGALTRDGRALGGIEQQLNAILRGEPGYTVLRRDARGVAQPALTLPVVPPKDGASVHLTIDFDLQEIADGALRDAMQETRASGGDLLIGDPRTGEILAAVSRRGSRTRSLTAITEPYEPGSTLKPFLLASLLSERKARLEDTVYAEKGSWQNGNRTFRDTSPHEWLTLREAMHVSSNIAFVKLADRLSRGQHYAYLRDFGFGTPTGIDYPAESSGRLRRPVEWSRLTVGSLAMGYEIMVTPLQMLSAYGALANGGVLLEPYLVREIRNPDGSIAERRDPTPLRRVIPEDVARAVATVLAEVVDEGTASRASLNTFAVAGKTGTSRRIAAEGGYASGSYTSSFVGFFPAQDPQIVIFVKLDEPQGAYYGGLTAAPVTRETLQGILAARTASIDGRTLLATRAHPALAPARASRHSTLPDQTQEGTYVFRVAEGVPQPSSSEPSASGVVVPDVVGLPMREAVRAAHLAGLRVRISGAGEVERSDPPAGAAMIRGEELTLTGGRAS